MMVAIRDVTSTDQTGVEKEDSISVNRATDRADRREKFDFKMIDISVGEDLQFVNDPARVCKVTSQKPPRVELDGVEMSLSAAAVKVKGSRWSLQGSLYWKYEDETLQERRERIEHEELADDE